MKKSTIIVKRLLALFLVVLMSIESFGALVSDNDGSAFITKGEFDSLKSSFQSQIDNYNTSIDSKIDGAIAAYLAGVKLTKKEQKQTFYAPAEGVLSLNQSFLNWQEGLMHIDLTATIIRTRGWSWKSEKAGFAIFRLKSNAIDAFYEPLIGNVDYTRGTGKWLGYRKTNQSFKSSGTSVGFFGYKQGTNNFTCYYGGVKPHSNETLTNSEMNSDETGWFFTVGAAGTEYITDFYGTNVLKFQGYQSSFTRQILDNDDQCWTGGIILNRSSLNHKFNNGDEIRDWCNDDPTDGHTTANTLLDLHIPYAPSHLYQSDPIDNWSWSEVSDKSAITDANWLTCNTQPEIHVGDRVRPYFGFVQNANNWNKIYTDTFDDTIDEVLLQTDTNKSVNIIVDSYGRHLKLGAGLPVIEAKEDDKITYEFEFKDKTQNYRVWVKEGSFDSTADVSTDNNNCIKTFDITDGTTTFNTTVNCLEIKNGKGKATFTATGKNVIYLKWAVEGNINDGRGILLPAKTVEVETY